MKNTIKRDTITITIKRDAELFIFIFHAFKAGVASTINPAKYMQI